ncbi:MAG: S41 family peptidase [Lachnospiraceae bacterium]|nr:S41 family peptidase [Lachnospiraceae bacterium]
MRDERDLEPGSDMPGTEEMPNSPKVRSKRGFARGFLIGVVVMAVVLVVVILLYRNAVRSVLASYGVGAYSDTELLDDTTEEKISMLAGYIEGNYYEEVDTEELRNGLYQGLFDNLDEYSEYYTPEEYEEMMTSTVEGTYSGIGATLQQDNETMIVTVIHVYDDSPAQKAGIQEGDIILKADEYDASEMELTDLVSHIHGEEGTAVHLEIYRDGEEMEFDVVRENLDYPTADGEMLDDGIGYIQISEFAESTVEQFNTALDNLTGQGMTALIIDLRYNPGGVLDSVCDIADDILPEGLIVYTEDRAGHRVDYDSTNERSLDIPLAILVNEYSASASEILAGAVQDRDAGTIIGTLTFGKGVVQTIRPLSDGSAVKMTTSRYFTPGGTCIQGIGITPDVELEYEFLGGDEDEYSYELDNQIQEAIEVLRSEENK